MMKVIITITSLPKVIWEEDRVAAKVSPHRLQWRAPNSPQSRPQSTPSREPQTRPTCDAKRHLDPIRRFATMHWTDRRTDAQTDRSSTESLITIGLCAPRATRPNNYIVCPRGARKLCMLPSWRRQ